MLENISNRESGFKAINDPRDEFSILLLGGSGKQDSNFNRIILKANPLSQII